jgi:hypothetical protein
MLHETGSICVFAALSQKLAASSSTNLMQMELTAVSPVLDEGETDYTGVPMSQQETHHPIVNAVEAREGVTGHNVRYVLVISIAGVVIAFGVLG